MEPQRLDDVRRHEGDVGERSARAPNGDAGALDVLDRGRKRVGPLAGAGVEGDLVPGSVARGAAKYGGLDQFLLVLFDRHGLFGHGRHHALREDGVASRLVAPVGPYFVAVAVQGDLLEVHAPGRALLVVEVPADSLGDSERVDVNAEFLGPADRVRGFLVRSARDFGSDLRAAELTLEVAEPEARDRELRRGLEARDLAGQRHALDGGGLKRLRDERGRDFAGLHLRGDVLEHVAIKFLRRVTLAD